MNSLDINLWRVVNKGKYKSVYEKKVDFDPEKDWYDDTFVGLGYNGEFFPCNETSEGIKQIVAKYPESLPCFDFDMVSFCTEYVKGLLVAISLSHGQKQVCFSKSNSELFSIVIAKNKTEPTSMWQDSQLKDIKDPVYCMVYSFVRDNTELFI